MILNFLVNEILEIPPIIKSRKVFNIDRIQVTVFLPKSI